MRGSHKFQGVSYLAQVYIIQPVFHNMKGGASRPLGVIGRTVPGRYKHELLKVIAQVARGYHPGSSPPHSREHRRLVRGRFQAGITLTGREARTVMGRLAGGMVLPLLFHSLVLAFCHIVHLCYGCTTSATAAWLARVWCTHILCTSFRNLRKKVALQPNICMGGPTLGLTRGPRCYILMRQGDGTSGWPKDIPLVLVLGRMPILVKVCNMSCMKSFCVRKRVSPLPKFGPLSIGTLFWRLAWLLSMHYGRQSSNACYGT